jgi:hypothetical protein
MANREGEEAGGERQVLWTSYFYLDGRLHMLYGIWISPERAENDSSPGREKTGS